MVRTHVVGKDAGRLAAIEKVEPVQAKHLVVFEDDRGRNAVWLCPDVVLERFPDEWVLTRLGLLDDGLLGDRREAHANVRGGLSGWCVRPRCTCDGRRFRGTRIRSAGPDLHDARQLAADLFAVRQDLVDLAHALDYLEVIVEHIVPYSLLLARARAEVIRRDERAQLKHERRLRRGAAWHSGSADM